MADFTTRDADDLLVWYRSHGRERRLAVQLYLARRAIASDWKCSARQAVVVIESAMEHVRSRSASARLGAQDAGMRKGHFLDYRARAGAWLRAGILDAIWRYEQGNSC
ncbi:hypothetical protein GCM10027359_29630 [Marilutibacter aestuarii]